MMTLREGKAVHVSGISIEYDGSDDSVGIRVASFTVAVHDGGDGGVCIDEDIAHTMLSTLPVPIITPFFFLIMFTIIIYPNR